jgi:AraC-like DNA-binding protein
MSSEALYAIDWGLRGATIGLLLLIGAVLLRDYRGSTVARLTVALAIGTSTYTICSGPDAHRLLGGCLPFLLAPTAGNNVVFWLFAAALFDDSFRLRWWHGSIWLLMMAFGAVECVADSRLLTIALILSSFVFAALALVPALATWRDDLMEGRRRIRGYIVIGSAVYTAVTAFANLTGDIHPAAVPSNLFATLALLVIVGPAAWTTFGLRTSQGLFASLAQRAPLPAAGPAGAPATLPIPTPVPIDPVEAGQLARLERLMTAERAYRQDGLTIGMLAQKLDLPEYRLRRLINQGLGYRNFNSFLNRYRIGEAKTALADSDQQAVPILTIAMDAGFSSLGPFNRAFKAETGLTPSDYRRENAGIGGSSRESASPIPNPARGNLAAE